MVVSKVDQEKSKKHRRGHWQEALDSLPGPFFVIEQVGLNPAEFQGHAGKCVMPVEFKGKKYFCLRREYPGEVLVDQLGDISGRYFAPPYFASAPAFLKEHSMGKSGAANTLGLDVGDMGHLIKSGEIGHFFLDGKLRLWRSDIYQLKSNGTRQRSRSKKGGKARIPEAATPPGITTGPVVRPVEDNRTNPSVKNELASYVPAGLPGEQAKVLSKEGERPRAHKKPPRRKETPPPEQEQLVLDDFQIEADQALQEGLSVLVSAPTGNGKTLVAEMLAKNVMAKGLGMIYTSPLKALSNQKFRDFKELFGENSVGLVTGDISINQSAPMLIMTTEIFRNWCFCEPEQLDKISYVVFDEIHYLDDIERGATWEESILFAPSHIKFLGLSATVPNVDEMADWISSVRGGNVVVILEKRRRVPLAIRWVLPDGRITKAKEARKEVGNLVEHNKALRSSRYWMGE